VRTWLVVFPRRLFLRRKLVTKRPRCTVKAPRLGNNCADGVRTTAGIGQTDLGVHVGSRRRVNSRRIIANIARFGRFYELCRREYVIFTSARPERVPAELRYDNSYQVGAVVSTVAFYGNTTNFVFRVNTPATLNNARE